MSISNQSQTDYKKQVVIVSQLQRVCLDCGAFAALIPTGWTCNACGSHSTGEVWEHMLDTFRRGLAEKREATEAAKVNPARTFSNVRMSCMDVLEYWFGEEEGSDTSQAGQLKDAGFGDFGPM